MRRFVAGRAAVACLVAALSACAARAGNFNTIDSVRPRIGQRGTTVEVTIKGSYLRDAQEIVFYRPGIRAVSIAPIGEPPTEKEKAAHWHPQLACVFEIAPDCPVGEHVFRVRSLTQLSMASTFTAERSTDARSIAASCVGS